MIVAQSAVINFAYKEIIVCNERGQVNTTTYISQNAENQMLVQIVSLERMGYNIHFHNRILDMDRKLENIRRLDENNLSNILRNMRIS